MPEYIIGIMSGSSLDGLSMSLCQFDEGHEVISWKILEVQTVSFPEQIGLALKSAPNLSGFELMKLDAAFGKFIGLETQKWIRAHGLKADYIASHGHTVFHEPGLGFTKQIGSGAHIAEVTMLDTITTFRGADVAAGGQGAPFAPVADKALFPGYEGYINLGGIANINLLTQHGQWKAWDIGPCNQALNFLAARTGHEYDPEGQLAAKGSANKKIVNSLLAMFPFHDGQPKGLSNAEVQASWIQYLQPSEDDVFDLLASVTEAISQMILLHLNPIIQKPAKILVTGGGARNTHLINRLSSLAEPSGITFHLPDSEIIDYKECLLMAYLGYLTMHGLPYGINNITGASVDTIGGAIFKAIR
jgi:anhydro-N-acetylmuramic acid kinase